MIKIVEGNTFRNGNTGGASGNGNGNGNSGGANGNGNGKGNFVIIINNIIEPSTF